MWPLVEKVVQVNLAEEGQGNAVHNESDLEPEEGHAVPKGEVESAGSMMNYARDLVFWFSTR